MAANCEHCLSRNMPVAVFSVLHLLISWGWVALWGFRSGQEATWVTKRLPSSERTCVDESVRISCVMIEGIFSSICDVVLRDDKSCSLFWDRGMLGIDMTRAPLHETVSVTSSCNFILTGLFRFLVMLSWSACLTHETCRIASETMSFSGNVPVWSVDVEGAHCGLHHDVLKACISFFRRVNPCHCRASYSQPIIMIYHGCYLRYTQDHRGSQISQQTSSSAVTVKQFQWADTRRQWWGRTQFVFPKVAPGKMLF